MESQRQRGEEMDAMLTERDRKLAEKEAYIVHLQTALAGDQPITPAPPQVTHLTAMWTEHLSLQTFEYRRNNTRGHSISRNSII